MYAVYVYVCVQFTFGRDEVFCFVASQTISSPVVQPTSSSKSRGEAGFLGVLVVVVTGFLGVLVVVVTGFLGVLVVVVTGFLVVVVTGFLVVVFVFGVFPGQTSPVFLVQTLPEVSRHLSALGSSRH